RPAVAGERGLTFAGPRLPERHFSLARTGEHSAVGRKGQGRGWILRQDPAQLPGVCIPDAHTGLAAAGRERAAVRCESHRVNLVPMADLQNQLRSGHCWTSEIPPSLPRNHQGNACIRTPWPQTDPECVVELNTRPAQLGQSYACCNAERSFSLREATNSQIF